MNRKTVIGAAILSISTGVLVYLYFGYLKPRMDVQKEMAELAKKNK